MIAEGIGTFFLVWAVVAVAVNPRAARDWAGLAIGGTLGFAVMIIGPLTGAALNPARWFGPALVAGEWDDAWVYIIGPIVGGVLGALVYWYLFVEGPAAAPRLPRRGPRACARTSTRRLGASPERRGGGSGRQGAEPHVRVRPPLVGPGWTPLDFVRP